MNYENATIFLFVLAGTILFLAFALLIYAAFLALEAHRRLKMIKARPRIIEWPLKTERKN